MKGSTIHNVKKLLGKNLISTFYRSLGFLSDESYVKLIYRLRLGRRLDLKDPKTFTEKLQWLKVNDHNPAYTEMADKLGMRRYVARRIGEGHTVPVLGVWDSFNEIDFNSLPDRFVLKTTHDSGSYVICTDKGSFDIGKACKTISRSLRRNYYRTTREWQYKNIEPKVYAEEFIGEGDVLTDYKFFCFNGVPRFMYVEQESSDNPTQAIFDMDYKPLPFCMEDGRTDELPTKPSAFEEMVSFAGELSAGTPFLRVDMYCVNGVVYIGELTFYHFGGYTPFNPEEWDLKIGEMLDLNEYKRNK